jgi:hypothetical protein
MMRGRTIGNLAPAIVNRVARAQSRTQRATSCWQLAGGWLYSAESPQIPPNPFYLIALVLWGTDNQGWGMAVNLSIFFLHFNEPLLCSNSRDRSALISCVN